MKKTFHVFFQVSFILCLLISGNSFAAQAMPSMQQSFDCATVTEIPAQECAALVALYNSTNGDAWTNSTNWLTTNTPSNWYGVAVVNNHVDSLSLSQNNLDGPIPIALEDLADLTLLDLSDNQLIDTIPVELGNLSLLTYLGLNHNALTGGIPPEIGFLTDLVYLNLGGNQLQGIIPPELGNLTNLGELYLFSNQLSGSIPTELGGLTQLISLDLSNNQLTDAIPAAIGDLSSLATLNVSQNQLSGTIPGAIGNLNFLVYFAAGQNQLKGPIPAGFWTLTLLEYLDLGQNPLNVALPADVLSLTKLRYLDLSAAGLTGTIPANIDKLAQLEYLSLWGNALSSPIPASIGALTNLAYLNLWENQLTGPIPNAIGSLINLQVLNLGNNQLSGDVPEALAQLTNLSDPQQGPAGEDGLSLDYNRLTYPAGASAELQEFLLLKDSDWQLTQVELASIPPDGSQFLTADQHLLGTVPTGAVAALTFLEYIPQPYPSQPAGELIFVNRSFQLNALDENGLPQSSFPFAEPVELTVFYNDQDLGGAFEGSLALYYWDTDSSSWIDASTTCAPNSGYTRELNENALTVKICHLTEFALMGTQGHTLFLPITTRP